MHPNDGFEVKEKIDILPNANDEIVKTAISHEIRIAVLPFRVTGGQEKHDLIISGFTDDLITNFSRFNGLSVISQFTTQHIRDISDEASIAELNADYLVTGSFRLTGKSVKIGVQLVRTVDKKVVFADHHEEKIDAILETQDMITEQIVSVLQQQIDYDLLSHTYRRRNTSIAAYENWLRGMNLLRKGSPEHDLMARERFEEALKIDSKFSRAYTGLSLSYFNEWSCHLWDRWEVSRTGAQKYALKALEIDENDYISLAVLGRTYLFSEEYEKAEHCLRKSLRMNPNDSKNLIQIAFSMMYLGYPEESERLYTRACTLNPLHQDDYFVYGSNIYLELGEYEKCIELGKKVDIDSAWVDFSVYIAAAYYYLSDQENMLSYWNKFISMFRKSIYKGQGDIEVEALKWHENVNPYRGETKLQGFRNYVRNGSLNINSTSPETVIKTSGGAFRQSGEMWEMTFNGQSALLKDIKGCGDIALLLSKPEEEVHCMELMGAARESKQETPLIDDKAKKEYKSRLQDLREEISEAEHNNNLARVSELNIEYEELLAHLSSSLGLGGKSRKAGSATEKARSAVTWRIRNAIKKIEKAHPSLARHLSKSIRTGTTCSYSPETPINWEI